MDIENWIALGAFILGALGFGVVLYQMNLSTQNKISENSLKILGLEKEVLEMKKKHEKDITEAKTDINAVRTDFASLVQEMRKENRQEHSKLFEKLDNMSIALTEVATGFKIHVQQGK